MPGINNESLRLRLKASKLISAVALILLFDTLAMFLTQQLGLLSGYFGLLILVANFSIYFILFFAFKIENEAEFLSKENKNGLLKALQFASIVLFFISLFFSVLIIILDTAAANEQNAEILRLGEPRVLQIKYLINLLGNVFTSINIIALFSIKIYLDEDKDKLLRSFALASPVVIFLCLLTTITKYLLKYFDVNKIILAMKENTTLMITDIPEHSIGNSFFNVFANILIYVSYIAILALFMIRIKNLNQEIKGQETEVITEV